MTSMKERAAIGTQWRRRRDGTVWTLWQSHRRDRVAELRMGAPEYAPAIFDRRKIFVTFADLRTKFEEVG